MHRVYNSAFMNMLKNEENEKYRRTLKNTLEFDPEILKRFVNFMNNPDEDTAVAQFGTRRQVFRHLYPTVNNAGTPNVRTWANRGVPGKIRHGVQPGLPQ